MADRKSRQLIPLRDTVGGFFKKRGWFRTERLLTNWYMLANDDIAVLIDTVKPKIVNLFVHGRYGTLRALLYDTGWNAAMSNWVYGIVPCCRRDGRTLLPLRFGAKITEPESVEFDPIHRRLVLKGLRFFATARPGDVVSSAIQVTGLAAIPQVDDEPQDQAIRADWTIQLADRGLDVSVNFTGPAESPTLLSFWYPLFTHAGNDPIDCQANQPIDAKSKVSLTDDHGRLPRLEIKCDSRPITLHPRSESSLRGACRLAVETGPTLSIRLKPNDVTLDVNPHLNANRNEKLTVLADDQPTLEIDGADVDAKFIPRGKGCWRGVVKLADGEHHLVARTDKGQSARRIFAHGDPRKKLKPTAKAYLKLQYKNGPLAGLFPYVCHADSLKPIHRWRGADLGASPSRGIRVAWFLTALCELLDDKKLIEALWRHLNAHLAACRRFDDGSAAPPPNLQPDGTPVASREEALDPSSLFETVTACTIAYRLYKRHDQPERARQCLEWAAAFAKTIANIQQPDGSFRRQCPSGTPTPCDDQPPAAPTPLCLLEYIRVLEQETTHVLDMTPDPLRRIIADHIANADTPTANDSNAFAALATQQLLSQLLNPNNNKPADAKAAIDAAKLSTYLCPFYPDRPQFYMTQANVEISQSHAAPLAAQQTDKPQTAGVTLMGKPNPADLNQTVMALALLRYRDDQVGLLLARHALASRLSTAILPSGAFCPCEIDVPGYAFKQTDYTITDANAAATALALLQLATDEPIL